MRHHVGIVNLLHRLVLNFIFILTIQDVYEAIEHAWVDKQQIYIQEIQISSICVFVSQICHCKYVSVSH